MLLQLAIFPVGKGESLSKDVAAAVKIIDKSGLNYKLTSMGSILEGSWDELMPLVDKLRKHMLKTSGRVYITMAIDDRKSAKSALTHKVSSVESKLKRSLRK